MRWWLVRYFTWVLCVFFAASSLTALNRTRLFSKTRWRPSVGTLHEVSAWYDAVDPKQPLPSAKKIFNVARREQVLALEAASNSFSRSELKDSIDVELRESATYFHEHITRFAEQKTRDRTTFSCVFKTKEMLKTTVVEVQLRRTKKHKITGHIVFFGRLKEPQQALVNVIEAAVLDDSVVGKYLGTGLLGVGALIAWCLRGSFKMPGTVPLPAKTLQNAETQTEFDDSKIPAPVNHGATRTDDAESVDEGDGESDVDSDGGSGRGGRKWYSGYTYPEMPYTCGTQTDAVPHLSEGCMQTDPAPLPEPLSIAPPPRPLDVAAGVSTIGIPSVDERRVEMRDAVTQVESSSGWSCGGGAGKGHSHRRSDRGNQFECGKCNAPYSVLDVLYCEGLMCPKCRKEKMTIVDEINAKKADEAEEARARTEGRPARRSGRSIGVGGGVGRNIMPELTPEVLFRAMHEFIERLPGTWTDQKARSEELRVLHSKTVMLEDGSMLFTTQAGTARVVLSKTEHFSESPDLHKLWEELRDGLVMSDVVVVIYCGESNSADENGICNANKAFEMVTNLVGGCGTRLEGFVPCCLVKKRLEAETIMQKFGLAEQPAMWSFAPENDRADCISTETLMLTDVLRIAIQSLSQIIVTAVKLKTITQECYNKKDAFVPAWGNSQYRSKDRCSIL